VTPHAFSLRQLQYAIAVAETHGFRSAAERCHVSQPSLSAQIAQLEAVLGARLFERDRRHVLVTTAGAELLEYARRVLADADALVAAAERAGDPLAVTVRIGVIPTVSAYLLPDVVPALRREFPRLVVLWDEEKTGVLLQAVREGRLEAALLALVPGMDDLERELVAEDPFVLAGPPEHPLVRSSRPAKLSELEGEKLLLLEDGHCLRDQALAICSAGGAQEAGFRATSLPTLIQMVAGGAGLTLLPSLSLDLESRRGELALRRFEPPAPSRTLVLAWRTQCPRGAALRKVAETFRGARRKNRSSPTGRGGSARPASR
jgi:LysR family transcriptional regulator, hydrogen peroxide-inducible genes activator